MPEAIFTRIHVHTERVCDFHDHAHSHGINSDNFLATMRATQKDSSRERETERATRLCWHFCDGTCAWDGRQRCGGGGDVVYVNIL